MNMVELLREVSGHPGVEENVRRDVEVKEFEFWRKLVAVLRYVTLLVYEDVADWSSPEQPGAKGKDKVSVKKTEDQSGLPPAPLFDMPDPIPPSKQEALSRANGLADGFVLLGLQGSGVEEGWHWVLNGKNEPTTREHTLYSIRADR